MSELKIYQNRPYPTEPMLNVSVEWVTQITENRSGKENRIPKITEPQYTIEGSDFVLRDDDYDVFVDAFINAEGKNNAFPFKCPLDYYCTKDLEVYGDGSYQKGLLHPIDSLNYQIVKQYSVGGVNTYKTITLPVDGTIYIYEDDVEVFPTVNLSTGLVTFASPPTGILKVECEFRLPMRFDVDDNQLNQIKRAVNSIYSANDTSIYLAVNFRLVEDMNYTRTFPFNSGDWKGNVNYIFDGNPLSDVAYSERSLTRIQSSDNKRELRDGLGVIRSKMAIANNNMNWNATQKYFNLFMACKGRLLPFTFEGKLVRLDSDIFNISMIGYSNVEINYIESSDVSSLPIYFAITASTGDQSNPVNSEFKILEFSVNGIDVFGQSELIGDATITGGIVTLVPALNLQAGAFLWARPFYGIGDFSAVFKYQINVVGSRDDGLAFVVTPDPNLRDLTTGGGLGYASLSPIVAVEFDIYQNIGIDPNDNHIAMNVNSDYVVVNSSPGLDLVGVRWVWVDYVGGFLNAYINSSNSKPSSPVVSYPVNINSELF